MTTNSFPELPPYRVDILHEGGSETLDCPEDAAVWLCTWLRDDLMVAGESEQEAGFRVVALIRRALLLPPALVIAFPEPDKVPGDDQGA